jgi:hypothetical protein
MNEPMEMITIKQGEDYRVEWPEGHRYRDAVLEFSFVRPGPDTAAVRAEMKVTILGRPEPLYDGDIILTTPTAVDRAAKLIDSKWDDESLSWGSIMTQACSKIRDRYREGEPIVNLKNVRRSENSKFLVEPLLYHNQANLFFGDGGLGKSFLALWISALVATGLSREGLKVEPGNVLYLDYETPEFDMKDRFYAICNGLGVPEPDLHYRFSYHPLTNDVHTLKKKIFEEKISLVVVDSAGAASGAKPEEAQAALAYHNALRSLAVTSLTIAHVSKEGGGDRGPFGSIFWKNNARVMWEIVAGEANSTSQKEIGVFQRKINTGAPEPPLAFRMQFDDPRRPEHVWVKRIAVKENPTLNEASLQTPTLKESIEEKLLEEYIKAFEEEGDRALFEGMTVLDLANEFDKSTETVSPLLTAWSYEKRLEKQQKGDGPFVKTKDTRGDYSLRGRWGLKSQEDLIKLAIT